MRFLVALLMVVIGPTCGSDRDAEQEPVQVSCEKYREHLLDLRLQDVTADREAHRAALRGALGDDFIPNCERNVTQADLDCVMAATTNEQLRACSSHI